MSISEGAVERAGAILEIDLGAIVDNWRQLAARVAHHPIRSETRPVLPAKAGIQGNRTVTRPGSPLSRGRRGNECARTDFPPGAGVICAAVVKADAYGLGAAQVAPALAAAGCKLLFVATFEEGLALRRLLPQSTIAVLNGLVPAIPRDFAEARLIPVLNDLGQIAAWRGAPAPAMLQVDTGMARLGLPPEELAVLAAEPERLQGIPLAAVISHLACADRPADPMNAAQRDAFRAAVARLPPAPASLAASSGIFLGRDFHFGMVRPGAALYGVNPLPGGPNPMRQVVHLKGRILQVREIDRGKTVGYGAAHRMDRPGRIATVAVGYADGWLRSASHRGSVGIAGERVPVVGRISMDLLTLDVTGIDPAAAQPGMLVDFLDDSYGVDDAAAAAGTIGYEILTALGRRALRVYKNASRAGAVG